jgi:hypothetical protein
MMPLKKPDPPGKSPPLTHPNYPSPGCLPAILPARSGAAAAASQMTAVGAPVAVKPELTVNKKNARTSTGIVVTTRAKHTNDNDEAKPEPNKKKKPAGLHTGLSSTYTATMPTIVASNPTIAQNAQSTANVEHPVLSPPYKHTAADLKRLREYVIKEVSKKGDKFGVELGNMLANPGRIKYLQ